MPELTEIYIDGVDEERLEEHLEEHQPCFVLYPSEDAVPISSMDLGAQPLAVLIDGTWNQAQRMHKHFEKMQHVVVSPTGA